MIDPTKVLNYNRTQYELEEFLLFCISVAGKTARHIMRALDSFLWLSDQVLKAHYWQNPSVYEGLKKDTPFDLIRALVSIGQLKYTIEISKLGQHNKLNRAFDEISKANFDLKIITVDQLESIHGIGPKTARYFIMYTQEGARVATLDTHCLKFMRDELGIPAPKSTPNKKQYKVLEKKFIEYADSIGKNVAELDLEIWVKYSQKRIAKK